MPVFGSGAEIANAPGNGRRRLLNWSEKEQKMEHEYLALAARIEAFELDEPGIVDTFSRRLARENDWSPAYTERVVREYKRFLILAVTATHVVSPSEQVDQAWHLHVLHAARYRRFCADVLQRRLDHGPSDGGSAEHEHFVRAYEQTLASYRQRFDEPPPLDVWPTAQRRFGTDLAVRRVNIAENWVLRKPRLWLWLRAPHGAPSLVTGRTLVSMGLLSAFVCGCSASLSDHASGPSYLRGFLLLWLLTVSVAYVGKRLSLRSSSPLPEIMPVLEPYALAQLAGGPMTALDSAVTSLMTRGCVELHGDGRTLLARREAPSTAPAFERDVYAEIARPGSLELRALRRQVRVLTRKMAEQLLKAGLVVDRRSKLPLLLALVAPALGAMRIVSRLGSDKPISFLVILTIAATVLAVVLFRPRRERTTLGDATVAQARDVFEPLQGRASAAELAENGSLPIMFSLFGAAAIIGFPPWVSLFEHRTTSYGYSDCGTSCASDLGGGCSGGGCSGGGGCSSAGCSGGGGCSSGCGGCSGGGD
jgi:uncharacterized protein (TIGR04222 family)